ncbi:MAG TPA: dUTP diphosphatase [Candidatus Eisenbacteria bacterium]|uniref:dUTP diphosphatase n=1 Tax=Eiseniibacteriota bacterium TaxID=2212470 RepID=A0A7V2AVG7_UNCEI|nr:dUTP diphosphatase [Candidatus Eisenbacteria bacterium]
MIDVHIRYFEHYEGLPPLVRMTVGSSGFDIHAACSDVVFIEPGAAVRIPAGFQISIPHGYEGQVRPRSGLALNNRVGILNSPGTIDSDYRGEVGVILYNFGDEDYVVRRGDRIAQIVFCRLPEVELVQVDELDGTARGPGGFGHTG